jgi:hypothetical protein
MHMRREYLFSIILAVAALASGAAFMVAPGYLHLTGIAIPITFWGGILLTIMLFLIAAFIALRGEAKSVQEAVMTPGDVAYNVGIAAGVVSIIGVFSRYRLISVIAAVIACGAVAFDFLYGPPRGSFLTFNIGQWNWLAYVQGLDVGNNQYRYFLLEMVGTNVGSKEIKVDDAYFVSGVTGAQAHVKVQMANKPAAIDEINPVPPRASLGLYTELNPPNGLSADDFLKLWGPFSFVVKYDGNTQRVDFTREQTVQMVTHNPEPLPYVTLRKQQK